MSFHQYRINELYSNASGTIQFIELVVGNANGEHQWAGVNLRSIRDGVTQTFTFPSNLPNSSTANTTVLIATQAFADLGLVTPNFIVPAGFLFTAGGTLNFGGADEVSHGSFPVDGQQSLNRSGQAAVASPRNFAGTSASLPLPVVQGTAGNDTLTGTVLSELVDGGAGSDVLKSGGGNDTLRGGTGDDSVYSGPGNDTLDGGDGWDYLYYYDATAGVNIDMRSGTATGGAGNDTLVNFELLFGSPFNDTFIANDAGSGFLGMDGDDTLTGGPGRDSLEGGPGNDTLDGLGGVDTSAFYSAAFAVVVNLAAGTASGGLGNDVLRNIENAVGSVFGDTLTGSAVDNELYGEAGNDTLVASTGSDRLDGGIGLDTAIYNLARSAYTLTRTSTGEHRLEKPDAAGIDTLLRVERLQFASGSPSVALDLDAGAGQVAKLLGAVFGPAAVANREYAGIGLNLVDGGMGYEALGALAVGAAGASTPAAVVALLWTNVVGAPPTPEQAAPFVAMLDGGMTIGALAMLAADTDLNIANINLVGLAQTGLDYLPVG